MAHVSHSSAVGSPMYAMVCVGSALSHAVSDVSMYISNPGKEYFII